VRVNAVTTAAGLADLVALAAAPAPPPLVLIPKTEHSRDADIVARVLDDAAIGLVPLVESVMGLRASFALAAHPRVAALMLGGADLSAELGVEPGWEALLRARTEIVMACAAHGKLAIDVPHLRLDDPGDLAAELARLASIGFRAKACIHPKQVAAVNQAFTPSPAEIATAKAVVAASAGAAVAWVDGRFVEKPVVRRSERLLDLARRLESRAQP
jgi:citrate lyase subunit beta/citryl-CoA lyase/(S)-citramalyl-CoA lyase